MSGVVVFFFFSFLVISCLGWGRGRRNRIGNLNGGILIKLDLGLGY